MLAYLMNWMRISIAIKATEPTTADTTISVVLSVQTYQNIAIIINITVTYQSFVLFQAPWLINQFTIERKSQNVEHKTAHTRKNAKYSTT